MQSVAAQQQTQQVAKPRKTAAAERISGTRLYMRCVTCSAPGSVCYGDPEKAKELTNEASALLSDDSTEWAKFAAKDQRQ